MKNTPYPTLKNFHLMLASRRLQCCALAAGAVLAAGMLAALADVCQEQVQRGERLRAEQRVAQPVVLAAAPQLPR